MTMVGAGVAVSVRRQDGEVFVTVAGELDAYNAHAFAGNVLTYCTQAPCQVVIDATDLDFLDSAGIQGLMRILHDVYAGGGEVTVRGATDSVHRILEVTGFSRLPAVNVEACA
jgi:anti-sigma B factor antagonist